MEELNSKRTSISLPEGLIEAAQSRLRAHYVTNFSDYVAALIRRDVQDHIRLSESGQVYMPQPELPPFPTEKPQTALKEDGSGYMPPEIKLKGPKSDWETKYGKVIATKPIAVEVNLDDQFPQPAPLQNVRKKKAASAHKPQHA